MDNFWRGCLAGIGFACGACTFMGIIAVLVR